MINNDKKQLRKELIALRDSLADRDVKSKDICQRLMSLECVRNADTVLIYASFGSEVDMWEIAELLRKSGISTAYPKCHNGGIMTFHVVDSDEQLSGSFHGICEPDPSLSEPVITDRTVCLVPGVSFTEHGERLGYGGGFYDRFLAENDIPKTALCFESLISDELPTLPHDIKVDMIVTEERTVFCNAEK